jgi:hypothetical protein
MKVLITGDSHLGALKGGLGLLKQNGEWPQQIDLNIRPLGIATFANTPFFIDKGSYAEIYHPEYRKNFKRFPPWHLKNSDVIFGFSGPLHTARIRWQPDWSKFVPTQLVINEAPVSNALLEHLIYDDCRYLLAFIDIILRTNKRLFVIEAPRPFEHALNSKKTRPDVFIFIDNYYRDFMRRELMLRNVPVVSVSPDCYDSKIGFMFEHYRHPDPKDLYHANAQYGEIMMENVLKLLLNEQVFS